MLNIHISTLAQAPRGLGCEDCSTPAGFALQEVWAPFADSTKCLVFGDLGIVMKVCFCSTHFTQYFMHNFVSKQIKS